MTDMTTWNREQILHWLQYGVSPAAGERTEPRADSAKATPAYTVVFQNAITRRPGSSVQRDCATFEAAVALANDFEEFPFNNTRVCLIDNNGGGVDRICPDRQHRFDFDSTGEILCVCGFRPKGVGADAEKQVEEHARQYGAEVAAREANGYHVKRTQIQDTSTAHLQMGRPSNVGRVQYSRTFADWTAASREAQAWRDTGDWTADVLPGEAP